MSDDLFERLRTVDPVTEERIAQETRALGNTPGRIMEGEPSNVRRFPKTARRKATLVAVAAVVVAAIAVPLALLRPLGDGGSPGQGLAEPGEDGRHWLTVGAVSAKPRSRSHLRAGRWTRSSSRRRGQNHMPSSHTPSRSPNLSSRCAYLYCEPAHRFIDTAGNVFDDRGPCWRAPGSSAMGCTNAPG